MAILIQKSVRVMLTGGGTGGHMYPLLAVADWLHERGQGSVELVFAGEVRQEFRQEFEDRYILTYRIIGSKIRRYADVRNIIAIPKLIVSFFQALFWLFIVMPDVVFSKGGGGSLPVVFAAWFYRIPVVVHESDAIPSLTTRLTARCARRVGVSFEETRELFPAGKVFVSGNPIRPHVLPGGWLDITGGKQYFKLDPKERVMLVLGGSQGSVRLNNLVLDNVIELLKGVQIIHQVGADNLEDMEEARKIVFDGVAPEVAARYALRGHMDEKEVKIALAATDVVLARAGASTISEIAAYGKPAILVPLKEAANDHQRANAYAYADTGAALVMEEDNLTPHVLLNDIQKLFGDVPRLETMQRAAKAFARVDAASVIGKEVLKMVGVELKL